MDHLDEQLIRDQLTERRETLLREHNAKLDEVSRSADHATSDEVDLASETADFDLTVHVAFRDSEELDSITRALRKLDEGTYGECEDCNAKIAAKRLQVLPFAVLCIDCQRVFEKSGGYARTAFRDGGYEFDEE
jgi:DnaK suppressor protein